MLLLLIPMVIFFWLIFGAVQYMLCVAVPRLRRYALSAALWWAVWGPCSIALIFLAMSAVIASALIYKDKKDIPLQLFGSPRFLASIGWGYLSFCVFVTAAVATGIAWFHQKLTQLLTFALFRVYATVVSAGIGSVFGWCLSWWILNKSIQHGWLGGLVGMLALVIGFGVMAYKGAHALRGEAPMELILVSHEEFEGL